MSRQTRFRALAAASAIILSACAAPNFQRRNTFTEAGSRNAQNPRGSGRLEHLASMIGYLRSADLHQLDFRERHRMFESAIYSMAALRDELAVPVLMKQDIRIQAVVNSLGLLGGPQAVHHLGDAMDRGDYDDMSGALRLANAISRTRSREAIPYLCRLWQLVSTGDPNPGKARELESDIKAMLDGGLTYEIALPQIRGSQGLGNPDDRYRAGAAFILGWMDDKESITKIIALARNDESLLVRQAAIHSLGMMGGQRALETLIGVLSERHLYHQLKFDSAIAIAQLQEPIAPALLELMGDQEDSIRYPAAIAVALSADRKSFDILIDMIGAPDSHKRDAAAYALGIRGDKRATEPLVRCLFDIEMSRSAAFSLALLDDERIPDMLEDAFAQSISRGGKSAVGTVFRLLGPDKSLPSLLRLLESENEKKMVAGIIVRLGDKKALPGLARLTSHRDPSIRVLGIVSIAELDKSGRSMVYILPLLDDRIAEVRRIAISALSSFPPSRETEERVLPLLYDENEHVRAAAVGFGWRYVRPITKIESMIDDKGMLIPTMRALRDMGAHEPLIRILDDDPDPVKRESAASSLGYLPYEDVGKALARASIADPSLQVRRAASLALTKSKEMQKRNRVLEK